MGLFAATTKRTPAEWKELLAREHTPVTLDEYVAGVLLRLAGAALETAEASQHLEGMVGAIDDAFDRHDDDYAGSATVRAALDRARDVRRNAALTGDDAAVTNGTARRIGAGVLQEGE
jgi:hypothetical protein